MRAPVLTKAAPPPLSLPGSPLDTTTAPKTVTRSQKCNNDRAFVLKLETRRLLLSCTGITRSALRRLQPAAAWFALSSLNGLRNSCSMHTCHNLGSSACTHSSLSCSARSECRTTFRLLSSSSQQEQQPLAGTDSRSATSHKPFSPILVVPRNTSANADGSIDELKRLVCACIPRAPLYTRASSIQRLVVHHETTRPVWVASTWNDKEEQELSQRQQRQQRQQKCDVAPADAFRTSATARDRLQLIRAHCNSLKEMLVILAEERVKSPGGNGKDPKTGKNAVVENVYRGGGRHGIYLSCDLVFVTVASSAEEAGQAFKTAYQPLSRFQLASFHKALKTLNHMTKEKATSKNIGQQQWKLYSTAQETDADSDDTEFDELNLVTTEDYCYPILTNKERASEHGIAAEQKNRLLSQTLQLGLGKNAEFLTEMYLPYFGDDFTPPPPPQEVGGASTTTVASDASHHDNSDNGKGDRHTISFQDSSSGNTSPNTITASTKPVAVVREASPSNANVFTPDQLQSLLPTYFVPVDALLAQLPPGYTPAHVRAIFSETRAVEVVQLGSDSYVRFHGGRNGEGFARANNFHRQQDWFDAVDERGQEENSGENNNSNGSNVPTGDVEEGDGSGAGERLRRYISAYKPDPYLLHVFRPRFVRPFQWVSLYDVVEHAPPLAKRRLLPLEQQRTLIYFAQMQHAVQFTPMKGGAVALSAPPVRSLREETTPLPRVLAEVTGLLKMRGVVYVEELERDLTRPLSDYAKRHVIAYFGTLRRFLYQHESAFRLSVVASPATLYEASIKEQKEEKEGGMGSDEGKLPAAGGKTSARSLALATEKKTILVDNSEDATKGKENISLSPPPLPSSLPRPGTGFISIPQPFHNTCSNSGSSSSTLSPHLDGIMTGISREEAQLDADGFPRWLNARDLAVQLEEEAKLRDNQYVTLEERLENSELKRNSIKRRKLRRRLAAQTDPNSPFSDPAVLLDAIVRYLPPTRHVALKALLEALPMSMKDFLPNDPVGLFRNNPDKVQLFEFRRSNHLRVMRPNVPLPDGRLRSSYTEEELLHLVAAQLPYGQSKSASALYSQLPYWARETVRLQHRHLVTLLERYPQYFVVVYRDAKREMKHNARISLLQTPPAPQTLASNDGALRGALSVEEAEAVEKADREMLLLELPPELRQTISSR